MEVYERWVKGTLYVGDVMSKPIRTVRDISLIPDAITIMRKHAVGCLVVTRQEKPIGILTQGDILRRGIAAESDLSVTKVEEIMSRNLITIGEDATIEAAARLMTDNSVKRLPVLRGGKLVGIITATDIVRKEPVLIRLLDELAKSKRRTT